MDPLTSRRSPDDPISTEQRSALAAKERTDENVHAASLDAERESRVDFVALPTRVPGSGAAAAASARTGHGWPLPDLSAFVGLAAIWVEAEDQLAEDEAWLQDIYGTQWTRLPCGHGPLAAQAKEILDSGLVPVQATTADSGSVLRSLTPFIQFTTDTARHLLEQLSLLGESLGADLSGLTLGNLHHLTHAILRLADAPPPNPAWCRPASARASSIALAALGEDVSEAAAIRQRLYEDFTEDLWDLPSIRDHASVDRWWQVGGRRTVRTELASASRTGKPPADLKATMVKIQRAIELREAIDTSWASLRGHLGWFADAPIPDADGATKSLAAMRELQLAMNEQVNETRLADLSRADAFVTDELSRPAEAISETISAWVGLARRFEGPDPAAFTPPELAQWAIVTSQSLDVLRALHDAISSMETEGRSADQLFDDAIARDRVDQLRELLGLTAVQQGEQQ
jgi:hypothetical protein